MKYTFYIFLAIILFSCGNEKSNETNQSSDSPGNSQSDFQLQKVDSVDFKLLGDPILSDVSDDGSQILFYDYASSEIISIDQNGQLLGKFSKQEDTPDAYGFMMELPGFIGNDQVALSGMRGIFTYNLTGDMITKIDHPESVGGVGFMPIAGKSLETVSWNGKKYLLPKSVRTRGTYPGEQAFYDRFRALEWVDVASGESQEIIPFEEGSLFKNGYGYIVSDYTPAFEWVNEKLYLSLGADPKLHIYQFSDNEFVRDTTILMDIAGFQELVLTERSEFQEGTVSLNGSTPAIRNIHRVNDLLVIHYFGGLDPAATEEAEQLWMSGNEEEAELLFEKLEREASKGLLIFDPKTKKFLANLPFPKGMNEGGLSAGGNFLWFQKAPSEEMEEDFVRFYKYKLEGI
ncbi:hypothetical protein [Algoriphagus hitonicola]|uniref:6-bladed beta-propeller protein n=1 Tax=Algoriphagus hitonicola TaxID=435880 RepID=A0A1I2V958_9BACT|nr:hypothetical protein [Algoriphagus hitonicola]SFG85894.1 hypothetical protein SAMN04487988_10983 [Algoriphagus hitonicola]